MNSLGINHPQTAPGASHLCASRIKWQYKPAKPDNAIPVSFFHVQEDMTFHLALSNGGAHKVD